MQPIVKQSNHMPVMDGMRVLMSIGIALFHLTLYFFPSHNVYSAKFDYFCDIFFLISAYLLMLSYSGRKFWDINAYKDFMWQRIRRIYPLYLASMFFYMLLCLGMIFEVFTPNNPDRYQLSELPYHLLLLQSWGFSDSMMFNYVAWALSALLLMYVLFPFMAMAAQRYPTVFLVTGAIALIAIDLLSFALRAQPMNMIHFENIGFLRALPSFMFGVWLAQQAKINIGFKYCILGLSLTSIVLWFLPLNISGSLRIALICVFMFFLVASDQKGLRTFLSWPAFKKLAPYSFGVYLLHPIIATIFLAFLMPKLFNPEILFSGTFGWVWASIGLAASIALSFIAAIIGYHAIEKPVIDYFKR